MNKKIVIDEIRDADDYERGFYYGSIHGIKEVFKRIDNLKLEEDDIDGTIRGVKLFEIYIKKIENLKKEMLK